MIKVLVNNDADTTLALLQYSLISSQLLCQKTTAYKLSV